MNRLNMALHNMTLPWVLALCACLLPSGCQDQPGTADQKTRRAPATPILSDEEKYSRLKEIDGATAQWCLVQSFSAESAGDALGYEYGPGEESKSEVTILAEQKEAISLLENDPSQRKETIDVWRSTQIQAANILRTCLGEEPLSPSDGISNSEILEIQGAAIVEMQRQRKMVIDVLPAGRGRG